MGTEQQNRLYRVSTIIKSTAKQLKIATHKGHKKTAVRLVKKLKASKANKKDADAKLKIAQAQKEVALLATAKAKENAKIFAKLHKAAKQVKKSAKHAIKT